MADRLLERLEEQIMTWLDANGLPATPANILLLLRLGVPSANHLPDDWKRMLIEGTGPTDSDET
jgi:hypothetical protein